METRNAKTSHHKLHFSYSALSKQLERRWEEIGCWCSVIWSLSSDSFSRQEVPDTPPGEGDGNAADDSHDKDDGGQLRHRTVGLCLALVFLFPCGPYYYCM